MSKKIPGIVNEEDAKATEPGDIFFARFYPTHSDVPNSTLGFMDQITGVETQIFAADANGAVKAAHKRGLGERVESLGSTTPPVLLPSEWAELGDWREAMHAACFLGLVAMKCGACRIEELLGDGGIIHNLAHLNLKPSEVAIQGPKVGRIKAALPIQLRALEARTPGYTRPIPLDMKKLPGQLRYGRRKVAEAERNGALDSRVNRFLENMAGRT